MRKKKKWTKKALLLLPTLSSWVAQSRVNRGFARKPLRRVVHYHTVKAR